MSFPLGLGVGVGVIFEGIESSMVVAPADLEDVDALPKLTEKAFQRQVIELAELLGWIVHAERPAMTQKGWVTPIQGTAGFPDLILAHPGKGKCLIRELKVGNNKPTNLQAWWLEVLGKCGLDVGVWTEKDWQRIQEVLR